MNKIGAYVSFLLLLVCCLSCSDGKQSEGDTDVSPFDGDFSGDQDGPDNDSLIVPETLDHYSRSKSLTAGSPYNEFVFDVAISTTNGSLLLSGFTEGSFAEYAMKDTMKLSPKCEGRECRDMFLATVSSDIIEPIAQFGWNGETYADDEIASMLVDGNMAILGGAISAIANCTGLFCQEAVLVGYDYKDKVVNTMLYEMGKGLIPDPIVNVLRPPTRITSMTHGVFSEIYIAGWVIGDIYGDPGQLTEESYGQDVFVRKIDTATWGNRWVVQLRTPQNESADAIFLLSDGGIVVAGTTRGDMCAGSLKETVDRDIFFARYDGDGNLLSCRQVLTAEDEIVGAATELNGRIILIGTRRAFDALSKGSVVITEFDPADDTTTSRLLPETTGIKISAATQMNQKVFLAAGAVEHCVVDDKEKDFPCLVMIQMDDTYTELSRRYFGRKQNERIAKVIVHDDRSISIVGDALTIIPGGKSNRDIWYEKWVVKDQLTARLPATILSPFYSK
ncbi:MAG TPA: hypothetical protein PKH10_00075 [bacterium]|nr:hypothetical protein [bacterium]